MSKLQINLSRRLRNHALHLLFICTKKSLPHSKPYYQRHAILRRHPAFFPRCIGPGGLVGSMNGGPLDDTSGHEVHFQASSLRSFGPINAEIGVQVSQLPIASPVAGFTFSAGVITPVNYFGPVLTDRAETLGKGKIFLGLSYQYFNFDKADGIDLKNFNAVLTHESEFGNCFAPPTITPTSCPNNEPLYTQDFVATSNRIDL